VVLIEFRSACGSCQRTLPFVDNVDGAFAAKFVKQR
jgi:hypothetical protein